MKRKILHLLGAIALFYESYVLPWTALAVVHGIALEMYVNRELNLRLLHSFLSGELPPSQTSLFLRVPFLIAMITYNLTFVLGLFARKKMVQRFESFQEILLPLATLLYFLLFNLSIYIPPKVNIMLMPEPLQYFSTIFGVTLMWVGFFISAIGILNLGNSFAIFVESRGMVTGGLYRFSRHPIYLGHFIRTVGMCFAVCFLFHVVANIFLIYLLVHRALLEEKKLLDHYPAYETYIKKTPCFFLMLFGKDKHVFWNPASSASKKALVKRRFGLAAFLLLIFTIGFIVPVQSRGVEGIAISKDGVPIYFSVYGKGEPTLVFVHGWSCNHLFWEKQIPYFKKKYRVVTLDLAGRGTSGIERSVYSVKSFGEDVAAVVRKIRASKVILIGHSLGGPVIIETAAIIPDHVKALVGVDSLQDFETTYTPTQIAWREEPFKKDFKKAMGSLVKGLCLRETDPGFIDKITARMLETPPWVGVSSMDELLKISYAANPPRIKAPIWCLNSDLWPTKTAANRKYVPEFNVRIMPGVGHFLMLEKPDEFNQQLDNIIKEIEERNNVAQANTIFPSGQNPRHHGARGPEPIGRLEA